MATTWNDWIEKNLTKKVKDANDLLTRIRDKAKEYNITSPDLVDISIKTLRRWMKEVPKNFHHTSRNKWLMICCALGLDTSEVNDFLNLTGTLTTIKELYDQADALAKLLSQGISPNDEPKVKKRDRLLEMLAIPDEVRKNDLILYQYVKDLQTCWKFWNEEVVKFPESKMKEADAQTTPGVILCLTWHKNEEKLVSGGTWRGAEVKVWNWEAESERLRTELTLDNADSPVTSLAWTPDGQMLIGSTVAGCVHTWDFNETIISKKEKNKEKLHTDVIRCITVSPDFDSNQSPLIASAGNNGEINIREVHGLKFANKIKGHVGAVTGIVFLNNEYLASTGADNTICIWKARAITNEKVVEAKVEGKSLNCLIYQPQTATLIGGGDDGVVYGWKLVWSEHSPKKIKSQQLRPEKIELQKRLAPPEQDSPKKIKSQEPSTPPKQGSPIKYLSARPLTTQIAVGTTHEVYVFNTTTHTILTSLGDFTSFVYGLAWNHDGTYLATGDGSGRVRILKYPMEEKALQ